MIEFALTHKHLPKNVFFISFIVFIFLNLIENIFHFTAGKYSDDDKLFHFELPSKKDLMKIIIIMFIFAFLQAILTKVLTTYF